MRSSLTSTRGEDDGGEPCAGGVTEGLGAVRAAARVEPSSFGAREGGEGGIGGAGGGRDCSGEVIRRLFLGGGDSWKWEGAGGWIYGGRGAGEDGEELGRLGDGDLGAPRLAG